MRQSSAVVAGRRGELPRRPAVASRLASLAIAALVTLGGSAAAADAQTWPAGERGRERERVVAERGPAVATDSTTLAAVAESLATAARAAVSETSLRRFRSAEDSVAHETTRAAAERDARLRVIVSLFDRELRVVDGASDTLLVADVAIGVDTTITHGTRTWRFETPRGRRTVLRKQANPVWVPPDWHYVEVATKRGLELTYLRAGKPVPLADGSRLMIRGGRAGLLGTDGLFTALPTDEEIVFDGKLFVPPFGTENRRIKGELGRFKLELGDGYLLHGTPYENTIGSAATHGCVRLLDEDIEWLYQNVPPGTPVYIY